MTVYSTVVLGFALEDKVKVEKFSILVETFQLNPELKPIYKQQK